MKTLLIKQMKTVRKDNDDNQQTLLSVAATNVTTNF